MATINVCELNDIVVRRLNQRASLDNQPLEREVRHILERVAADDMAAKRAAFLTRSTQFRRATEGRVHTPAAALIREDRDQDPRDS